MKYSDRSKDFTACFQPTLVRMRSSKREKNKKGRLGRKRGLAPIKRSQGFHEEQWERCLEDISEICRGAPPITVSDAEIQINFPGQSKLKRIIQCPACPARPHDPTPHKNTYTLYILSWQNVLGLQKPQCKQVQVQLALAADLGIIHMILAFLACRV